MTDKQAASGPDSSSEIGAFERTLSRVLELVQEFRSLDPMEASSLRPPETLASDIERGVPLLNPDEIRVRPGYAKSFFERLLRILEEVPGLPEPARVQARAVLAGKVSPDSFLEASLNDRTRYFVDLARENNLDLAFLVFVAVYLARPVRQSLAVGLAETVDLGRWGQGVCPCCGHRPAHSRIDPDGRRFLWCNCCATSWRFPRLACPFCGNRDQEKLRHFFLEGDDARRVDVCDLCRRYTKVKLGSATGDLDSENLLTFPLDEIAAREGYLHEITASVCSEAALGRGAGGEG